MSNSDDEKLVLKLADEAFAAFNRHDAKACATFYANDADLIILAGRKYSGLKEIRTGNG
jgi:uncharacterized protein (TIGR02246 family)